MDVARPPQKKTGRNIGIGVAVLAVVVTTIAVARLKPAAPTVDMSVSIQDSVRRGDMIREMRGPGTLVPEQIQQVTAPATARVDRMDVVQPGQTVNAGRLLVEMSSPDVMISTMNADQQLNQAQSNLLSLRSTLQEHGAVAAGRWSPARTRSTSPPRMDAAAADTLFKQHADRAVRRDQQARPGRSAHRSSTSSNSSASQIMQQSVDSEIAAATIEYPAAQVDRRLLAQQAEIAGGALAGGGRGAGADAAAGQFVTDGSLLLKVVQPGQAQGGAADPRVAGEGRRDRSVGQSSTPGATV